MMDKLRRIANAWLRAELVFMLLVIAIGTIGSIFFH